MRHKIWLTAVLAAGAFAAQMVIVPAQHAHGPKAAHSADTRMLVHFPPELANHTLANMRDHLFALQEINEALARGDNGAAATIAENRLGMSSLRAHGAHQVSQFMPAGMQEAGTSMHRAASRFAIAAQDASVTGDLKLALKAMSGIMTSCVGCHAGYRLK
jgi:hypothetical protein